MLTQIIMNIPKFYINLDTIILLVILWTCHWIFDFLCQRNKDAINKWHSLSHLLSHTMTYSMLWLLYLSIILGFDNLLFIYGFTVTTFFFHSIQDYFTSKITHYLYDKALISKNYKNFFSMIGFDQLLHFIQIVFTWYFFQHLIK